MRLQLAKRAFLVNTHQPAIAGDVACHNRGKPAVNARLVHEYPPQSTRVFEVSLWSGMVCVYRATLSLLGHKRTNHCGPKSTFVRFGRWSQLIDATLYL